MKADRQDHHNVSDDPYEAESDSQRRNPHQIQRYRIKTARPPRDFLLPAVIVFVVAKYKGNIRRSEGDSARPVFIPIFPSSTSQDAAERQWRSRGGKDQRVSFGSPRKCIQYGKSYARNFFPYRTFFLEIYRPLKSG